MKLTEFLSPENIRQGLICSSKKRVLEVLSSVVVGYLNQAVGENKLCPVACFSRLFHREKLGSTAISQGVALPHAKLLDTEGLGLQTPIAVFLQLETAVDYEAADHREVDLVYAVFFPEHLCAQEHINHYKAGLAELAERLSDKHLLKHLRAANSSEDIWQVLVYADKHYGEHNE